MRVGIRNQPVNVNVPAARCQDDAVTASLP
jgi:hypothetical protein